jgi:teichuronic acid biosynthesis glycosyltransferase TuaC
VRYCLLFVLASVHRDPAPEVLIVTNMWPEPDRPAYGIHVTRQVDSLVAAGLRCDVLYLRGYVSPLVYGLAAPFLLWSSLAWWRRYRLVHAYVGETALVARFHVGAPITATYLGDDILGDRRAGGTISRLGLLRARLLRAHAALFARTITISRAMEDVLPRRACARNVVIPQGVDDKLFYPFPRDEARAALGWDAAERVVLLAATKPESPAKRLWLAREACALVEARLGAVRLEVVSGIAPETVPLLMNAADCLLVTSPVEGSPNVVKEALMCNLPVIATRVGDIEELLKGVSPTWLCSPKADELAAALTACLEKPQRSDGRTVATRLAEGCHSTAGRFQR